MFFKKKDPKINDLSPDPIPKIRSRYDFKGATIGQVLSGEVTIEGDNIGIQNNYPSSPSSKEDLIEIAAKINEIGKQLQDLLNLDPTNPDDRVAILTMGKKALERQPQLLDRLAAVKAEGNFTILQQFIHNPLMQITIEAEMKKI